MVEVLKIIDRNNDNAGMASLEHFSVCAGEGIQPDVVIKQGNITPYCLDHASQQLIFADIPSNVDLTAVPFVNNEQKARVTRLIAVSYHELADLVRGLPLPEKLIFVHATGRSGSTLFNQILNQFDRVSSFSEPDFFTNFIPLAYHSDDHRELTELLIQCVTLFTRGHRKSTVGIKLRAENIDIAGLLHDAFPTPRLIGRSDRIDPYLPKNSRELSGLYLWLPVWIFNIECYLRAYEQGVPFFAFRYEDLTKDRWGMLARVFDHIGIPSEQIDQSLEGFKQHSQEQVPFDGGSKLRLTKEEEQIIFNALKNHPLGLEPDVSLPGTVDP
jgi:hypothetical protein